MSTALNIEPSFRWRQDIQDALDRSAETIEQATEAMANDFYRLAIHGGVDMNTALPDPLLEAMTDSLDYHDGPSIEQLCILLGRVAARGDTEAQAFIGRMAEAYAIRKIDGTDDAVSFLRMRGAV